MPPKEAAQLVRRLRTAPIVRRKAKDLLRASTLSALPPDNVHVAKDLAKVKKGGRLPLFSWFGGAWKLILPSR